MAMVWGAPLKQPITSSVAVPLDQMSIKNETWMYQTALDELVCPQCGPLNGMIFETYQIKEWFPFYGYESLTLIRPNTHLPRDHNCRCIMLKMEQPQAAEPPFGPSSLGVGNLDLYDMESGTTEPGASQAESPDTSSGGSLYGMRRMMPRGFNMNPMSMASFATRDILRFTGLTSALPIVSMLIPLLMQTIDSYIDEQVKKQFEERKQKMYTEIYGTLNASDRNYYNYGSPS